MMKHFLARPTPFAMRLGALTALSAFAFQQLVSPTAALAIGEACESMCSFYRQGTVAGKSDSHSSSNPMSLALAIQVCGPMPGGQAAPGAGTGSMFVNQQGQAGVPSGSGASRDQQGIDPTMRTGDKKWDDCFKSLVHDQWPVYGQHCAAVELYKTAHTGDYYAVAAYGIAALACGAACASEWTGALGGRAGQIACSATGAAATINDIVWNSKIKGIAEEEMKTHYWGMATGTLGGVGTLTSGAGFAQSSVSGQTTFSCIAAGLFAAAATTRAVNLKKMGSYADNECSTLKAFIAQSSLPTADRTGNLPVAAGDKPVNAPIAGNTASGINGSGGGNGSRVAGMPADVQRALRNFPNAPQFAQATAGDAFEPIFKNIEGKDKMKEALEQAAGLSIDELAGRLASGQSLSQIASQAPGLASVAAGIAKIEKDVKDGNISLKNSVLAGGYSRPSVAKRPAAQPFGLFGGVKSPITGGQQAPAETTFEKAKRDLASSEAEGDIWHEGFGGTIFQIVSQKLDRTRERIDQLEWESPLNRALMGLPAKKPGRAAGIK